MKLYLLRHEDRTIDCTFFSPLTLLGLKNSVKLKNLLVTHNINKIYSSPFIRTIQTIFPYSKKHKIPINLEYGLSEFHHQDIIPKQSVGLELPDYIAKSYNVNCQYTPVISHVGINYPETMLDVEVRVKKILQSLIKKHYKFMKFFYILKIKQMIKVNF